MLVLVVILRLVMHEAPGGRDLVDTRFRIPQGRQEIAQARRVLVGLNRQRRLGARFRRPLGRIARGADAAAFGFAGSDIVVEGIDAGVADIGMGGQVIPGREVRPGIPPFLPARLQIVIERIGALEVRIGGAIEGGIEGMLDGPTLLVVSQELRHLLQIALHSVFPIRQFRPGRRDRRMLRRRTRCRPPCR